jgi:hypothetical protein
LNQTQPIITNSTASATSIDKVSDKGKTAWNALLTILAILTNFYIVLLCFRDHWRRRWEADRDGWRGKMQEEVRLQLEERERAGVEEQMGERETERETEGDACTTVSVGSEGEGRKGEGEGGVDICDGLVEGFEEFKDGR